MNSETYKAAMDTLSSLEKRTQDYRLIQRKIELKQNAQSWLKSISIGKVQINGFLVDIPKPLELKSLILKQLEEEINVLKKERNAL